MEDFTTEGWRAAGSHAERVYEAAQFFANSRRYGKGDRLNEAFSTSDFPVLLGDAFEKQAIAAQKAAVFEFAPIVQHVTVPDFQRHKLVDLWGADAFEKVGEGEEYKGGSLNETELSHGTAKQGKVYKLTFELRMRRMFSDLAKFPTILGNGAVKGRNNGVAEVLTKGGTWNTDLFGTVGTETFTPDNLDKAIKALALREDHRGDQVDTSSLVLVFTPGLRAEVNRVLTADRLRMTVTDGNKQTITDVANPYRGVVTPLESRTLGKYLGDNAANGWALVQGSDSGLPSLIETGLEGHDGNVDIRVKNDQGTSIGGGAISTDDGSFNDDTIAYRGRDFYGFDPGFTTGVYASTGAGK